MPPTTKVDANVLRAATERNPRRSASSSTHKATRGGHPPDEGEEHGRPRVEEEGLHVHVEARLEDDRRQQPNHEELEVELLLGEHLVLLEQQGRASAQCPHHHADRGLWDEVDVLALEDRADDKRRAEREDADDIGGLDDALVLLFAFLAKRAEHMANHASR
eukprot:41082-Prymnesium_polylepis.1